MYRLAIGREIFSSIGKILSGTLEFLRSDNRYVRRAPRATDEILAREISLGAIRFSRERRLLRLASHLHSSTAIPCNSENKKILRLSSLPPAFILPLLLFAQQRTLRQLYLISYVSAKDEVDVRK